MRSWVLYPLGVCATFKKQNNFFFDTWWETWQENLHQDEWRFLSVFLSSNKTKEEKNQQIDFDLAN